MCYEIFKNKYLVNYTTTLCILFQRDGYGKVKRAMQNKYKSPT